MFLEAGGGWVPYWLARLDHQVPSYHRYAPEVKLLPSEYFARQCWISFEIDEATLPALAPFVGDDRIVWGSDYPHADSTFPGALAELRQTIAPLGRSQPDAHPRDQRRRPVRADLSPSLYTVKASCSAGRGGVAAAMTARRPRHPAQPDAGAYRRWRTRRTARAGMVSACRSAERTIRRTRSDNSSCTAFGW